MKIVEVIVDLNIYSEWSTPLAVNHYIKVGLGNRTHDRSIFTKHFPLQNKYPGGRVGSTSRGWKLVGLGMEMGGLGG